MKIQHLFIALLTISTSTLILSCSPYSSNMGSRDHWYSSFVEPTPELRKYKKIPVGHPDPQGRSNMVVSPYRPYNVIDISGYKSGDIVGDPSTAAVNPSTGKRDANTIKHFRIP